jgi:periplasmic copper chaperone A
MHIRRSHFRPSFIAFIVFIALAGLTPAIARAHVSIASGLAFANTTQEVVFGVGHGCAGADTSSVQIEIPTGVGSVRPQASGFGQVDVETDAAGAVVAVTWQKADDRVLESDTQYCKLTLRLKLPDQPFSTLYFPAHQTCRSKDGGTTLVDWVGIDEAEGSGIEPAPALRVVPARFPGWNKFTMPAPGTLAALAPFFADAQIVWLGNSAYSSSPMTTELIAATSGASSLSALEAGDQVWVKY